METCQLYAECQLSSLGWYPVAKVANVPLRHLRAAEAMENGLVCMTGRGLRLNASRM